MRDDIRLSLMGCAVDHEHAITFCCLSFLLWSLAFWVSFLTGWGSVCIVSGYSFIHVPLVWDWKKKIPAVNCEHIELKKDHLVLQQKTSC